MRGGDITKQGHESLKSVLSVSSQGHADLSVRLTSLGLPEPGSKARGALSDGGDTWTRWEERGRGVRVGGFNPGSRFVYTLGLDIGLIMATTAALLYSFCLHIC